MKKWLYVMGLVLVTSVAFFLHGCGKDTGNGVGGKVIIKGAGE